MDYSQYEKIEVPPSAPSLIESFRSIGYNIETAVADIVDNSISAGANKIWIRRYWNGSKTMITIKDNGHGMANEEIINAMRLGSRNPLEERDEDDLGRFGLGLKTASFSQCRKLTVCSKTENNAENYWTWDLDYVAQCESWNLLPWKPEELIESLDDVDSGTLVVWSKLDRVIPREVDISDENAKRIFLKVWDHVKGHIALTFHRFLERSGHDKIRIYWGDYPIKPWNPFLSADEIALTSVRPTEFLGMEASVRGYILRNQEVYDNIDNYQKLGGEQDYLAMQGYYVYRGDRLLSYGSWLGLYSKKEYHKYARISIDIPNTTDSSWQIDIKKSKAVIPIQYQQTLKRYTDHILDLSRSEYYHLGRIIGSKDEQDYQPLWISKLKDNQYLQIINRENSIIKHIIKKANIDPKTAIYELLRVIENTIPKSNKYGSRVADREDECVKENYSEEYVATVMDLMQEMYLTLKRQYKDDVLAKERLKTISPFSNFKNEIDQL